MADELITCPLCAFEFARADTLCHHGCPLGAVCRMVRCPSCSYEYPPEEPAGSWLDRLLGRQGAPRQCLPDTVRSAGELEPGARAAVICAGSSDGPTARALTVFGLAPGAEIEVLQQRPACVVRVGETELALDPEIARQILVEPRKLRQRSASGGGP